MTFDRLLPWNEHPTCGHQVLFRGKLRHRTALELNAQQAGQLVRLELGAVKHIAQLRVNRKELGVIWTAPWTADLSGAVREGENELEIDVVNLWVNRLIGDARLPVAQRLTKTNVPLTSPTPGYRGYNGSLPLETSGLLGPVRLVFGEECTVPLD